MNPRRHTKRRNTVSATESQMGIFTVFFELLGVALFLPIGVRFLTAPELSDGVAWGFLAVAALFLIDGGRRLFMMATGRMAD